MRPLLLNDDSIKKLRELVLHAEKYPLTFADLIDLNTGKKELLGEGSYICFIPVGFKVVLTIDLPPAGGKLRHLSISVDGGKGNLPNPIACKAIMAAVGFKSNLEQCKAFIEDCKGGIKAINIVEII